MQRDLDLVRQILLAVEAKPTANASALDMPGYSDEQVTYHIRIMLQAGLLEVLNQTTDQAERYAPTSLTWAGHEFLDLARSDTLWEKAKTMLLRIAGALSLAGITQTLKTLIDAQLLSGR